MCLLSCEQFRKLVCEHLAACLCVKYACCAPVDGSKGADDADVVEPSAPMSAMANDVGNHRTYLLSPAAVVEEAAARRQLVGETERLLVDIRDLLRTTVRDVARLRREKDEIQRLANDWVIASAVIDRLCCLIITLFFIAGTITLVVLLFVRSVDV